MPERIITEEYLRSHPNEVFVFGDNLLHLGLGGAAALRNVPNTYGFLTKRYPDSVDSSFYSIEDYIGVYNTEIARLKHAMKSLPNIIFLISKLGAGLANRYHIFEEIIEPNIKDDLKEFKKVVFLW